MKATAKADPTFTDGRVRASFKRWEGIPGKPRPQKHNLRDLAELRIGSEGFCD